MKSVTFDEKLYKIVPLEPTKEICNAGHSSSKDCAWSYARCYKDMLAAVPYDLPGVVLDTGEPVAYFIKTGHGTRWSESVPSGEFAKYWIPLFRHPAPDAATIVKAALEAAARSVSNNNAMYEAAETWGFSSSETVRNIWHELSKNIRSISPKSVLDGLNK